MKIKIMMKSPDVLDYALENLDDEESETIKDNLKKWFRYGEVVTLVYDTEQDTLTVKEL